MRRNLPMWLLVATGLGCDAGTLSPQEDGDGQAPAIEAARSSLYIGKDATLWTENGGVVPVCWIQGGFAREKGWISRAIQTTWGRHASIWFTGFGACPTTGTQRFVRVLVTASSGTDSGGRAHVGMHDAFKSPTTNTQDWSVIITVGMNPNGTVAATQGRIEYLGVHEFGHVLGFAHEQERPDNPDDRAADPAYCRTTEVHNGGTYVTDYDRESIMHYCNSGGNNSGRLSEKDILGIRGAYGTHPPGAHPRIMADVNNDGRADIVGFDDDGVRVSLSTGSGFSEGVLWVAAFGRLEGGWNYPHHPRFMADVNNDGRSDVVGFANGGVHVSLSTGTSFTAPQQWVAGYGYDSGDWRVEYHPRFMADVNNDGRSDVVGFANGGVLASPSTGTSFSAPATWVAGYGYDLGWR